MNARLTHPSAPGRPLQRWLLLLAMLPLWVQAQGITDIVSDNRSSANSSLIDGDGALEFSSRTSFSDAVLDGPVASFTHRMAWFGGAFTGPQGGGVIRDFTATLSYGLTFTVQDPMNQGYTLSVDNLFRGVLSAQPGVAGYAVARLPPLLVSAFAAFEPGAIELGSLTTTTYGVEAGGPGANEHVSVDFRGRAEIGHWRGTRSFLLAVDSDPQLLRTYGWVFAPALAFLQFGQAPRSDELSAGYYTGDATLALGDLGHFLQVQAVYATSPVPEPATWALLAAGLGIGLLRFRRGLGATGQLG